MKIPSKKTYSISVHQFVDMITRGGDLLSGVHNVSLMQMGTEVHINAQNASKHQVEVPLSYSQQSNSIILEIKGRADIVDASGDVVLIEELKTLFDEKPKKHPERSHMLQMQTYCAMYVLKHDIQNINGQITYIQYDSGSTIIFPYSFTKDEILDWFFDNLNLIVNRFEQHQHNINVRNLSVKEMKFPYKAYRLGQKDMASLVYKSCMKGKSLFVEAPTGIGKTLAALYPAIKAMAYLDIDKVFYLSSKTTIKNIAVGAIETLRSKGLKIKSITLTAKEKSCPQKVFNCHPSICYRARGYFDRVQMAMDEIDYNVHHNYESILSLANKYSLCPFELSLDIATQADIIICDYNNVYDPRAKLKRFFNERGQYTILVDEAHNLVGRAREMYSSTINSKMLNDLLIAIANDINPITEKISTSASILLDFFDVEINNLKSIGLSYRIVDVFDSDFITELMDFTKHCEAIVNVPEQKLYTKNVIDCYYDIKGFLYTISRIDDAYISYSILMDNVLTFRIFCMDPSNRLSECHKVSNNTVFFSASLTPAGYYARLLQTENDFATKQLASPFDRDNLHVMLNATNSIEYKNRDSSMRNVVSMIYEFAKVRRGNYLAFFPSYAYMEKAHNLFTALYDDIFAPKQQKGMTADEQEAFIELFSESDSHMIAFAVMGGMFSEGIDLAGNRLIGAVVVGTGFPMISLEGNMIRSYHDENEESGIAYAYIFPGFNKVLQSVGRVVRTENDKGAVLLIDRRLAQPHYIEMMPDIWQPIVYVDDEEDVRESLVAFWGSMI